MESAFRDPIDDDTKLIETMLWTPEGGVHRRDRHLERLSRSAARLGFAMPDPTSLLDGIDAKAPQRLRMTLDRHGTLDLTTAPHHPLNAGTIWSLRMAREKLESTDPWLTVKSTRRDLYDRTRAEMPESVDEVIFVNERNEVCEGAITNFFADFGQGLVTPPASCGLLPGVLRDELLSTGRAHEQVIPTSKLREAKAIFVGNALRGLIKAHFL